MLQEADQLWIFDGDAVPFMGLPYTTRMIVIRLPDGGLWVHSPIKLTDRIGEQLATLGPVRYLIAPNRLHHLFLSEWQSRYPEALCYGTPGVIRKRDDLNFRGPLDGDGPWPWAGTIDQVLFAGSPVMEECVFFHKPSRTLIVADLVENFPEQSFKPWQRIVARATGIMAPHGKMPLDWRLSFVFHKSRARRSFAVIMDWQPQRLVMAHGCIVRQDATRFLTRSFQWLAGG